jgi:membrane dipeptidase
MSQDKINKKVVELHEKAIIIDGHCDILIPMTEGKMNVGERVQVPDLKGWQAPPGLENSPLVKYGFSPHTIYFGCMGQYDIPRWQEAGLSNQLCAIYLDDSKLSRSLHAGLEMAHTFHDAIDNNPELVLCTTVKDIKAAKAAGKIGLTLSFEGCEALGRDIRMLDLYYKLGLRSASLTHTRRNIYADGCWDAEQQGGLTALGKKLVKRMEALKIVIDLVHIGEKGYWEILDMVEQPVILSHSTPTMFASTDPHSKDLLGGTIPRPAIEALRDKAMLEALQQNGGVLGMIWVCHRDLDAVVKDIETAMEIIGPDHIGLGTDHYGAELAPRGLEDISKLPALTHKLVERGHSDEVILKFLGQNYLRVFEQVWGE